MLYLCPAALETHIKILSHYRARLLSACTVKQLSLLSFSLSWSSFLYRYTILYFQGGLCTCTFYVSCNFYTSFASCHSQERTIKGRQVVISSILPPPIPLPILNPAQLNHSYHLSLSSRLTCILYSYTY